MKFENKKKIGKFRSADGANDSANVKSCILTYKKQGIDLLKAIKSAFVKNVVIA